jgi:hypothetical protein
MNKQTIFIAIIIALGIAVAGIGSFLLWLNYQPSTPDYKDYSVDNDALIIDSEGDLWPYTKDCPEDFDHNYQEYNLLIKDALETLNDDFSGLQEQGYVLRESCKFAPNIFLFMDSYNKYWQASEAGAGQAELDDIARTAVISYAPYSKLDFQEIKLNDYNFESVACHLAPGKSDNTSDTTAHFYCKNSGASSTLDIYYRYDYESYQLTELSRSRNFFNNKTEGSIIYSDPDLGYSFSYPAEWGDATTEIGLSVAARSAGLPSGDPHLNDKYYRLQFESPSKQSVEVIAYSPGYVAWEMPSPASWGADLSAEEYCQLFSESVLANNGCQSSDSGYVTLEYAEWNPSDMAPFLGKHLSIRRAAFVKISNETFPGIVIDMSLLAEEKDEYETKTKEEMIDVAQTLFDDLTIAPHGPISVQDELAKSIILENN